MNEYERTTEKYIQREKELKQEFCKAYTNWSASVKNPDCRRGEYVDRFYINPIQGSESKFGWVAVPEELKAMEFKLWKTYCKIRDEYFAH